MTPTQCRMARTGLGITGHMLAKLAGVGPATVARFEGGSRIETASLGKLRLALEGAGASFSSSGNTLTVTVPGHG